MSIWNIGSMVRSQESSINQCRAHFRTYLSARRQFHLEAVEAQGRNSVARTVGLREQEGTEIRELSPFPFRGTTWEIVLWNE